MFENLTERLTRTFKNLSGQGRLTEENMQQALREVRLSLLEADVALPVIKEFIEHVKQKALGQEVMSNLRPDQALVKIVHDELVQIMGDTRTELDFKTQPPAIFLMAGLQGSGKTTSAAKLARYLKETEKKKIMLVSVDIYRPAAIQQLKLLANELDVAFFSAESTEKPLDIARKALDSAKKQFMDVVIIDTAGRLHIDVEMMSEIKALHQAVKPVETLFVVDSMTGQDAAHTAKAFHEALPLTGVILTKTDGDARGGAALSVRHITGQPIKFMGSGEKIDALEPFHPDRIASRILDMGDVVSLVEKASETINEQEALALGATGLAELLELVLALDPFRRRSARRGRRGRQRGARWCHCRRRGGRRIGDGRRNERRPPRGEITVVVGPSGGDRRSRDDRRAGYTDVDAPERGDAVE